MTDPVETSAEPPAAVDKTLQVNKTHLLKCFIVWNQMAANGDLLPDEEKKQLSLLELSQGQADNMFELLEKVIAQ